MHLVRYHPKNEGHHSIRVCFNKTIEIGSCIVTVAGPSDPSQVTTHGPGLLLGGMFFGQSTNFDMRIGKA